MVTRRAMLAAALAPAACGRQGMRGFVSAANGKFAIDGQT